MLNKKKSIRRGTKTKKLYRAGLKKLSGGALCCNVDLNKIESVGFEVEFHNLLPVNINKIVSKYNITAHPTDERKKGTTIYQIDDNTKLTIDFTYVNKNIYSIYKEKGTVNTYNIKGIINEELATTDCEFHSLYLNLRSANSEINIIKLFHRTLVKIKEYLAKFEKISVESAPSGKEKLTTTARHNTIDIYLTNKQNPENIGFIGLNDSGYTCIPQMTLGIALVNVKSVVEAYLQNSGIKQLLYLYNSVNGEYKKIKKIYDYSHSETDYIDKYYNDNRLNMYDEIKKYFRINEYFSNGVDYSELEYNEHEIEGILYLLSIEIVNAEFIKLLENIPSSESTSLGLPMHDIDKKCSRYTHIRLRYIIYDIIFNKLTKKILYFLGLLLTNREGYSPILDVIENLYCYEDGDFPKYDGNIVLLEFRTFNDQLSKLIKIKGIAADKENNRNRTIDEYIQAMAQNGEQMVFVRNNATKQQSKHASFKINI